ncbi:SRPBCC family protein [Cellulophaga baltica]|uniref:SRPBCC family protein n=1 Tax=Cellulophaga TaxID=104264 RepID=UPI001C06C6A7|nr:MULTISPECIES: SRPBCC family protein [Cellulophaga]MBU2997314.1 SRPBCC family protein [Cellulophaga baltica]MDO6768712.1 SRPBCC family protein [Cellulophaga sp. 1_MG-2023]
MKLYRLHAKQTLPISQKEAWDFLSNPANLKVITPESMGFKVLAGADKKMFAGQIIQYTVAPLPGVNTRWVTEITHVNEGTYFVDEQRFGPYSLWHHKHFIKKAENGIEMEDIIDYKIPFGIFGQLAQYLFIKKQLTKIFNYREEKLIELFGDVPNEKKFFALKSI